MRNICFTRYNDAYDTVGKPETLSWEAWAAILTAHTAHPPPETPEEFAALKNGPAIVLGKIPAGRGHRNSEVTEIHALALDMDDIPPPCLEAALDAMAPWEWVLYSTISHNPSPEAPQARLRLVLPLARSLSPESLKTAWERLDALTGYITDRQTSHAGRLYFLPAAIRGREIIAHHNATGKYISIASIDEIFKKSGMTPRRSGAWAALNNLPSAHPLKDPAVAILEGRSFATSGERHTTLLAVTKYLAQKGAWVEAEILAIFRRSLFAMRGEDSPPTEREVLDAYRGAREKYSVASQELPYTEEQLGEIAEAQGCDVGGLERRWILQTMTSSMIYLLEGSGGYQGPMTASLAAWGIPRILSRAPVRTTYVAKSGEMKTRALSEVLIESGSLVRDVVVDLAIEKSRYDAVSGVLYEAVPRPVFEPEFDDVLDDYLNIFAGRHYERLCDWLACAPDLDKLLCAVYFMGAPGAFKSNFVLGLAKLWHDGQPSGIECLIGGGFNAQLARCPLVFADEKIPEQQGRKPAALLEDLRAQLATTERRMRQLYQPEKTLKGAIRLALASNDDFLLKSANAQGPADIEATAQRFLLIHVGREATDALRQISFERKKHWVREGIARHVLALRDMRADKIVPGARFVVEGDLADMGQRLIAGSAVNSLVLQWLMSYLSNPRPLDAEYCIKIHGGSLLVNSEALYRGWNIYLEKSERTPSIARIDAALRAISIASERPRLTVAGRRIRFRKINTDILFDWAESLDFGDLEAAQKTLESGEPPAKVLRFNPTDERGDY